MPERLGQNFLKDVSVINKIIDNANINSNDLVFEIGPGKGVLTEELLKKADKVVAVELDDKLVEVIKDKFSGNEKLDIIHQDVLNLNLKELDEKYGLVKRGYRIIANIPYYITSKIIRLFLESAYRPNDMILMIQKEVAERIVAKPGKMSILAVSVQYYAKAEILFTVSRDSFDPAPEVDSAVIRISDINKEFSKEEAKKFFRVVKAGYCARRKTLLNNLSNSLQLPKDEVLKSLESIGRNINTRAQELSVEDWKNLVNVLVH